MAPGRPLSSLLSQVLVAFTIELDNEFELRMNKAGHPGARLSLALWMNLMRFLTGGTASVRELAVRAMAPENQLQLGCLERWGFVLLHDRHRLNPGWGSGRGIRADWNVRLTSRGLTAIEAWQPLIPMMERRWEKRFGKEEMGQLKRALREVTGRIDLELPLGLPGGGLDLAKTYPHRSPSLDDSLPLPALLSQLLLAFRLEFDRESVAPLVLCANTLRVLGTTPVRLAEIPRLTGGSPETTDIGWQLKPYVIVEPDPSAKRGKVVRLSPRGLLAQAAYHHLTREIEKRWEDRFGKQTIRTIRESLESLFEIPLFAEGLVPPEGTTRAGDQAPALGRRDVGPAAKQRMRDLVAQTEAFVQDPVGSLPHYPSWDMNRGFGP